jgi:hypothetical protein
VKNHARFCYHNQHHTQDFKGRKAEREACTEKVKEAQQQRPDITCEGKALGNIFHFKYLGSMFTADGSQDKDLSRRIAMAMQRCGQLRHVFDSDDITVKMKISIYKAAVMSILTYGCEAWQFTAKAKANINGANARCLSRITGQSAHQEASRYTHTYDLVTDIRKRKFQWLDHILILRLPGDRLIKHAVKV